MSYEYRLVFDGPGAMQRTLQALRSSDAFVGEDDGAIWLKDRDQQTLAVYDASFKIDGDSSAWVQINFQSLDLYELLRSCLVGRVICLEDGDDEVALSEAFRLKGIT